ncbi:MAG: ankyrin repeat domain-containing protein [Dehalococcoidia bacterium]
MPFFIVELSYIRGDDGISRGYKVRNRAFATRAEAEAALAAIVAERQARRAAWEQANGLPLPGEDRAIVAAPSVNAASELAEARFGAAAGDPEARRESLTGALVQAADGYPEWSAELLSAGADPNGMPLIMAIQSGELGIVQAMLAAGADPNRAFQETTPLIRAIQSRYPAIVRALLDRGADVRLRAPSGIAPLQAANSPGRRDVPVQAEAETLQLVLAAIAEPEVQS